MQVKIKGPQKRGSFLIIFGLLWLVFAVPFLLFGLYMIRTEQRFAKEGITVAGTLTNKTVEENREKDRETKKIRITKSYYAHYSFATKEGVQIQAKDSVDKEVWDGLSDKSPIQIQYLPDSPNSNRVARESSIIGGVLLGAFGVLALIIGVYSLGYDIKKRLYAKRLINNGFLTDGTILRVRMGELTINDITQYLVDYSYRDQRGGVFEGRSEHMTPEEASAWKEGDKCKVRFDRDQPSKSIWLGQG